MKIIDNFLELDEFVRIETLMLDDMFPWYYNKEICLPEDAECEKKDNWQFVHLFYLACRVNSDHFEALFPIIEKIEPRSLVRIKANCGARTEQPVLHGQHIDFNYEECITSIFYLNTNNGFTQFKTGEKVESVANRLVIFPAPTYHSGVSCTDEQVRVVINFNYF